MSDFPKTLHIQWTFERVTKELKEDDYDDEDSENEDSVPMRGILLGESIEEIEIDSWSDIPTDYEPSDDNDREDYYEYLDTKNHH